MARKKKTAAERALAKEIKEMEVAKKQKAMEEAPKPKAEVKDGPGLISFDKWWMQLVRKITIRPSYKEVIKADFKARGLVGEAPQEEWDKALELYGIKL